MTVLSAVAITATLAIDFFIFIFFGTPKWSPNAIIFFIVFSITIFFVSIFYSWSRYSVKTKILRNYLDNNIYLSLRGVGKGSWIQIPIDCIMSCNRSDYRSPFKGFWLLLISDNAPFQQKDSPHLDTVYPLPGYVGQGIVIEYKQEKRFEAGWTNINMLIPSNNPESLCTMLTQKHTEFS